MHLPDINVWLALTFVAHVHHNSAQSWFDGLPGDRRCYFCRFTQQGFLRLANNAKVFPQAAVTQDLAWKLYDTIFPIHELSLHPNRRCWNRFGDNSRDSRGFRQTPGAMLIWPLSPSPAATKS
jgi:predicted nucleic acid-binding protein